MTPAPRVLYLTGWCRSGTTLVGNVLDTLPAVCHVGELHYLWQNGVARAGTNSTCGCGEQVLDCPLWSAVLKDVAGDDLTAEARRWTTAQQAFVRTRHTSARLRAGRSQGPAGTLASRMADLYAAIARHSGADVVVDSSKYPAEAALLAATGVVDLRVLHLVRDPRATAYSWRKPKDYIPAMSTARSTGYWTGFNLASEAVTRAHRSGSLRMRYEDFCSDPASATQQILDLIGSEAPNPVSADGTVELGVNHTVTGNPDRLHHGRTQIRPDDRWRGQLAAQETLVATALAGPLLPAYGYPLS